VKVVAAALYAASDVPDDRLLEVAQKMTEGERRVVLEAYVGRRTNRRHRPGRAFERTSYRFDVLADYGAFRDLQRHRLLTLEWQRLSPHHGSVMPEAIVEARVEDRWHRSLGASAALHDAIAAAGWSRSRRMPWPCLPAPLLHGDERAGGDASHRAAQRAPGPPGLPACRADDARLIAERAGHARWRRP